jgi:hypothetical protein
MVFGKPPPPAADEPPTQPSIEDLRRYDDVRARIYVPDMTLRKLMQSSDFAALPESMRTELLNDIMRMATNGEINGRRFIEGSPE